MESKFHYFIWNQFLLERFKFLGPPTFYGQMKLNLTQLGYTVTSDGSEFIPKVTVPLNERDKALLKQIITTFEELDQVEGVHTNAAWKILQ